MTTLFEKEIINNNGWLSYIKWKLRILKNKFTIVHIWESHYTGLGYKQGIGFDVSVKRFSIGLQPYRWFSVITDIRIDTESEWLDKLKDKLK